MAIIQINFMSGSIARQTTVQAILPLEVDWPGKAKNEIEPLKTLYLLHGIFGDCNDWLIKTRIEYYAEKYKMAVIMPSGENSFYVDNPGRSEYYGRYIGEELVNFTRKLLPLSKRREDTFIGGLSMGGYGAIRNGLKYSETFSAIIGLSSGLVNYIAPFAGYDKAWFFKNRPYFESVFHDLNSLTGSDMNPDNLILNLLQSGKDIPRLYLACGTEDELLDLNQRFVQFVRSKGVDATYIEGPGEHDWNFWDTYIEKAMMWLSKENGSSLEY